MNVAGASAATSLFIQPKSSAGLSYVNVVLGNPSNSFSGPVVFTNSQSGLVSLLRVVKLGNPGEKSSMGTATNISVGGASGSTCTLDYMGMGEISSKTITLGGSSGTVGLSQSGSGHLKLTGNILPGTTAGARTLSLSGSTSGTGEVASDLADLNGFALSLTKSGTGTWTLSGSNSYSGLTTVRDGALVVNGYLPANAVTVTNNAILGGLGSIQGNITVRNNGILRPGSGATNGLLTARGTLTVDSGGSVSLTIDNMAAYGRISNSAPVINGTINVAASGSYVPATGNIFQLFSGAISGTPTLNVTPLSNPSYVWVTNDFLSTGQISVSNIAPVLTPYQSWLTNYPTLANTNGTADPDGDGFNNNLEFAFDGNPTVGTAALLTATRSGSNAVFNFVASTNTNAVSYTVQSTTNLSTGPWADDIGVTASITNSANQTNPAILLAPDYVRREFSLPATNKSFYRVEATIAP
jgi:autotransporter-associated beta strand protein